MPVQLASTHPSVTSRQSVKTLRCHFRNASTTAFRSFFTPSSFPLICLEDSKMYLKSITPFLNIQAGIPEIEPLSSENYNDNQEDVPMTNKKIGPIEIIRGERNSKVPFSTSLLVEGKDQSALIDCGGGHSVFQHIKETHHISDIYLTHYHIDHVWGAHLFEGANIHINPRDYKKLNDYDELAKASGAYATLGEEGAQQLVSNSIQKDTTKDRSWSNIIDLEKQIYPFDKQIDIAGQTAVMIHTPGHCEGYCSPYFPDYGVIYVGDFDLTSFGPWYNNADSDIDLFIESAYKTLEIEADYYVTGHQKGTFEKKEYKERLMNYLDIIDRRENDVKKAVKNGVPPKEIVWQEIFYFRKNHHANPNLMESEILGIAKHIKRLIKQGESFEAYYKAFVSEFNLHKHYIDY